MMNKKIKAIILSITMGILSFSVLHLVLIGFDNFAQNTLKIKETREQCGNDALCLEGFDLYNSMSFVIFLMPLITMYVVTYFMLYFLYPEDQKEIQND